MTPCLQEKLVKKMTKKVRSKEQEQELSVQGIFMSIQDMKDEKMREERINSIRADCEAGPKGLIGGVCQTQFSCPQRCTGISVTYVYMC